MKRGGKILWWVFKALVVTALVTIGFLLVKAMPIGTGYTAKYLCSSTFVSEREPGPVFEEDVKPVNPLARLVDYTVDRENRSVTADVFGMFAMTAIYMDGCGCALVIDTTADKMRQMKIAEFPEMEFRPSHRGDLAWPTGSQGPVAPASVGIDAELLTWALDDAFAEPTPDAPRKTRAVVVVYDGKLVAERYAPGFNLDMPLPGWSMSKSVTNALVGLLFKDGKLDLLKPAPIPEWRGVGDERRQITLDQLMRMSSGLVFEEVYAPLYDATAMLYGSFQFAAYAAQKPLASKPDQVWNYSSGTANIIARLVRQTIENDMPAYYRYFYERLFDRIGMYSTVVEPDASGTFVGSSYTLATARDWARFGLLYLNDGLWQGQRILPPGWVKYTTTPTAKAPQGQYGAMWWLNAGDMADPQNRKWPSAPTDAYAAQGFQEQKVIVIPSLKLVLVRLGATAEREQWDTDRFIKNVIVSLPKQPSS